MSLGRLKESTLKSEVNNPEHPVSTTDQSPESMKNTTCRNEKTNILLQ